VMRDLLRARVRGGGTSELSGLFFRMVNTYASGRLAVNLLDMKRHATRTKYLAASIALLRVRITQAGAAVINAE
jgi:hypothetical protein